MKEKSSTTHQQTLKEVEDQKTAKKKAQQRKVRGFYIAAFKQMLTFELKVEQTRWWRHMTVTKKELF